MSISTHLQIQIISVKNKYLPFCVWLILLSTLLLFTFVAANSRISFFYKVEEYPRVHGMFYFVCAFCSHVHLLIHT